MKHKITTNNLETFSAFRLKRMEEALFIAIELPCTNKQFLEYCNRLDCIKEELSKRGVS